MDRVIVFVSLLLTLMGASVIFAGALLIRWATVPADQILGILLFTIGVVFLYSAGKALVQDYRFWRENR